MRLTAVILILTALFTVPAPAEDAFSDDRFRGVFTTENLDRIITEYELNDGWYWTGEADVPQTFHGREGRPGWTDTAVNVYKYEGFVFGWYGYRWARRPSTRDIPTITATASASASPSSSATCSPGKGTPTGNGPASARYTKPAA